MAATIEVSLIAISPGHQAIQWIDDSPCRHGELVMLAIALQVLSVDH